MASRTMQEHKDNILKLLKEKKVTTIALVGGPGVGKTWMARQIRDGIGNNLFYGSLWISMNKIYDDRSLYGDVACQLSIHSSTEEYEDDVKTDEARQEEKSLNELKKHIRAKLNEMSSAKLKEIRSAENEEINSSGPKAFLLTILDDIRGKGDEEKIMPKLQALLPEEQESSLKVIITRRDGLSSTEMDQGTVNKPSSEGKEETEIGPEIRSLAGGEEEMEKEVVIKIGSLPKVESGTLFKEKIGVSVSNWEDFKESIENIAENIKGLPAAVVILIAAALKQSGAHDSGVLKLKEALKEAEAHKEADKCIRPLLHYGIDMLQGSDMSLPGKVAKDIALVNCYWHSWEFFRKHGAIHYNELILSWILEGYVGSVDHVEEAYEEGHHVLMKLIDHGMLKMQEDDLVIIERLALTVPDCRCVGYEQTSRLGLASVLENDIWQGFGVITPADGMIKTPCSHERWNNVSTLLIDGSRLCREVPSTFFQPMKGLQHLAIFNPSFKSLPSSLSEMDKLCMLVLRGCDQLQKIDHIQKLKSLTVLEISGASFLEEIPDVLFELMIQLQSLNFRAVPIKSLPSSLSKLRELRWLTLRDCSSLKALPKLKALENLEVLDLSGATSLRKIEDKTLSSLQKLQLLDFSHAQIIRLPIIRNLKNLTQLFLRGSQLTRLPILTSLSTLRHLDLSSSKMFKEIKENFSENMDSLKILDLSNTGVIGLPSNFGNLPNLELLDLSDASKLVEIPESTFEKMGSLRQLFLRRCPLKKLPKMEGLKRLEVLDLSDCSEDGSSQPSGEPSAGSLKGMEAEFLKHMSHLQVLNLSGTRLKLPHMSNLANLTNLTRLSLRGCSFSESEPNFGEYTKLEILDLSETEISSLPSINNLSSLRELKLRDNPSFEQLQHLESLNHLEVLDLWGTGIQEFPYEISELTLLKHLDLPKCIQQVDWGKIKHLPEDLNWDECGIFEHSENRPCMLVSGAQFFEKLKKKPEFCETCFKQFHFSVCSFKEQDRAGDIYWHRVDPIFRKIYFRTLSFREQHGQYLEVLGFDSFPAGVEDVLMKSEYLSLIENKFIKRLSDLGVGNVKAMKGCWLERCTEMETISCGEEVEARMGENLEILWVSNLPKLRSVYSEKTQCESFKNLAEIYLDCCPMLKYVFHSSQLPEKLKILQIKFCDALERVFEPSVLEEHKLQNLEKLHLVELPKLTSMGVPESKSIGDIFPSLKVIKVKECPKLEKLKEIQEFADGSVENSAEID